MIKEVRDCITHATVPTPDQLAEIRRAVKDNAHWLVLRETVQKYTFCCEECAAIIAAACTLTHEAGFTITGSLFYSHCDLFYNTPEGVKVPLP